LRHDAIIVLSSSFEAKKENWKKKSAMKCVESFLRAISNMASQVSRHMNIEASLGENGEMQVKNSRLTQTKGPINSLIRIIA
jgi:hypothetical protein